METQEIMQLSDLDLSKTYTYADYLQWKFDERIELIKGRIFKMSPAPSSYHQEIAAEVTRVFANYLKGKTCKVYPAPFDVRLTKKSLMDEDVTTVVQPDICVVCDRSKIDKSGCIGAPDIVVEILSPGNNKTELQNKYDVYEENGVQEYWIVSPQQKTFLKYVLNQDGVYVASKLLPSNAEVTTPILPGFVLKLEDVFADN
ncbi:Uma2 family endonuclease [uncultured Mucilaginibacter sp.]|uniref:Uma2 family endonuclease n=1 Tax=uncultured Mucilaginibacter sp. TaxID=797541 RepID=UPI00261A1AC1|nr:Uma2 family endonuclease [uncultured Mucilaginibacter sp.]